MSNQPPSFERILRQEALRKEVTDQFMRCVRNIQPVWDMPALEALADHTEYAPPSPISVRIFDMTGEAEVRDPSPALLKALEEYQSFCASSGSDWCRCLITLILSPDRKTGQFQWNYSYPW